MKELFRSTRKNIMTTTIVAIIAISVSVSLYNTLPDNIGFYAANHSLPIFSNKVWDFFYSSTFIATINIIVSCYLWLLIILVRKIKFDLNKNVIATEQLKEPFIKKAYKPLLLIYLFIPGIYIIIFFIVGEQMGYNNIPSVFFLFLLIPIFISTFFILSGIFYFFRNIFHKTDQIEKAYVSRLFISGIVGVALVILLGIFQIFYESSRFF